MAIVIGSVTINRNPAYPLDWFSKRFNQSKDDTADGGHIVYDNGPSVVLGTILIKNVIRSEAESLRTYLEGTAVYQLNSFTMTPVSGGETDLGKGQGTAIQVFFDGGSDLSGVFSLRAPDLFDIQFPYREDTDGIP